MAQGTQCLHAISNYMRKVELKYQHVIGQITQQYSNLQSHVTKSKHYIMMSYPESRVYKLPRVSSTRILCSDKTAVTNVHKREYFTLRVCTGYTEVGYSPPPIYYELLLIVQDSTRHTNGYIYCKPCREGEDMLIFQLHLPHVITNK